MTEKKLLFLMWLEYQGVLDEFEKNYCYTLNRPAVFLLYAFVWEQSKQGHTHWFKLNKLWLESGLWE